MAKYKYTSNKDSQDGTEVIVLESGEELKIGGEAELEEAELEALRARFNLREVDGGDSEEPEAAAEAAPESSQKASKGVN